MKKLLRPALKIFLLILLAYISYIVFYLYNRNHIDLGSLTWENCGGNKSVLKDANGNILIGPAGITLWGKYPYVYGHCGSYVQNEPRNFIIDIANEPPKALEIKDSHFLHELETRGLDWQKTKPYWSLKGQWGNKALLKQLKEQVSAKDPANKN